MPVPPGERADMVAADDGMAEFTSLGRKAAAMPDIWAAVTEPGSPSDGFTSCPAVLDCRPAPPVGWFSRRDPDTFSAVPA
jgi:hypothetical protein